METFHLTLTYLSREFPVSIVANKSTNKSDVLHSHSTFAEILKYLSERFGLPRSLPLVICGTDGSEYDPHGIVGDLFNRAEAVGSTLSALRLHIVSSDAPHASRADQASICRAILCGVGPAAQCAAARLLQLGVARLTVIDEEKSSGRCAELLRQLRERFPLSATDLEGPEGLPVEDLLRRSELLLTPYDSAFSRVLRDASRDACVIVAPPLGEGSHGDQGNDQGRLGLGFWSGDDCHDDATRSPELVEYIEQLLRICGRLLGPASAEETGTEPCPVAATRRIHGCDVRFFQCSGRVAVLRRVAGDASSTSLCGDWSADATSTGAVESLREPVSTPFGAVASVVVPSLSPLPRVPGGGLSPRRLGVLSSVPPQLRWPLVKVRGRLAHVLGWRSGVRSAIVCANGALWRLKGCGNNDIGFPVRSALHNPSVDSDLDNHPIEKGSLLELRGSLSELAALTECRITAIVAKCVPTGNIPRGIYYYSDAIGCDDVRLDVPEIPRFCAIFETAGDKRLAAHLIGGIERLLTFFMTGISDLESTLSNFFLAENRSVDTSTSDLASSVLFEDEELLNLSYDAFLDGSNLSVDQSLCQMEVVDVVSLCKSFAKVPKDELAAALTEYYAAANAAREDRCNSGLAVFVLARVIGRKCGHILRSMRDQSVVWGRHQDVIATHCNCHPNNVVVALPETRRGSFSVSDAYIFDPNEQKCAHDNPSYLSKHDAESAQSPFEFLFPVDFDMSWLLQDHVPVSKPLLDGRYPHLQFSKLAHVQAGEEALFMASLAGVNCNSGVQVDVAPDFFGAHRLFQIVFRDTLVRHCSEELLRKRQGSSYSVDPALRCPIVWRHLRAIMKLALLAAFDVET